MSDSDHNHIEPCPICQPFEFRTDAAGEALGLAEHLIQFISDNKELKLDELSEPGRAFLAAAVMQRSALLEIAALLRAHMLIPVPDESDEPAEEGEELH